MNDYKAAKIFLWIASIGLLPIALSYGLIPELTIPMLFEIEVTNSNLAHIFRAVMGLYLGMIFLWIWGASNRNLTLPALYALVVFMLGLAIGRLLSLLFEGIVHPLLEIYMLLEFGFGFFAIYLIQKLNKSKN